MPDGLAVPQKETAMAYKERFVRYHAAAAQFSITDQQTQTQAFVKGLRPYLQDAVDMARRGANGTVAYTVDWAADAAAKEERFQERQQAATAAAHVVVSQDLEPGTGGGWPPCRHLPHLPGL